LEKELFLETSSNEYINEICKNNNKYAKDHKYTGLYNNITYTTLKEVLYKYHIIICKSSFLHAFLACTSTTTCRMLFWLWDIHVIVIKYVVAKTVRDFKSVPQNIITMLQILYYFIVFSIV